ncbi:MAG: hypothetical protein WDZ35_09290 [Crocinitomicaceae bacterium]
MFKILLAPLLFITFHSFSLELPKQLLGHYESEVPAFEFEYQNKKMKASTHHVSLYLKENSLRYSCGKLDFYGSYTEIIEGENILELAVNITNDHSVDFDFGLKIDKKTRTLIITGLKGVPEMQLNKREIVLTKRG